MGDSSIDRDGCNPPEGWREIASVAAGRMARREHQNLRLSSASRNNCLFYAGLRGTAVNSCAHRVSHVDDFGHHRCDHTRSRLARRSVRTCGSFRRELRDQRADDESRAASDRDFKGLHRFARSKLASPHFVQPHGYTAAHQVCGRC